MSDKLERYKATMVLHAIGDAIGYNNGDYEFNFFKNRTYSDTLELFYDFLGEGGINHFSLKKRIVSDDTLLHMAVAKALLKSDNTIDDIGKNMKREFIKTYDKYFEKDQNIRRPGLTTMDKINELKDGREWFDSKYNFLDGGSGASMRNPCIGLAFNEEDDIIQISIETSKITHNSTTGYLGGFTSALFTNLAIRQIDIIEWPKILLNAFKKKLILNYFKKKGTAEDLENYIRDSDYFIAKWKSYYDDKFVDGKPIYRKSFRNLVFRSRYYDTNISTMSTVSNFKEHPGIKFIGGAGDDSVIIAYDCLLDAGKNWEKLVIYSMLHIGDTDTTGCLAGAWYGALYGFEDVPKHYIEQVEFSKELHEIGEKLYKKYNKIK
ncbi:MAG: hypothetical protein CMF62_00170 [Magnetococcales bacterium]|nr:hypothetical protein [Magnetococcales bacterium]|tara:strand:+ start:1370 stop:2503 length:1134 start_codon:yes stop_codon:yes gene_type:complete